MQADAQSKVAGTPLLPAMNFTSNASRSRSSQAGGGTGITGSIGVPRALSTMALNASPGSTSGARTARTRARRKTPLLPASTTDVVVSELSSPASPLLPRCCFVTRERLRTARENLCCANRVLTPGNQPAVQRWHGVSARRCPVRRAHWSRPCAPPFLLPRPDRCARAWPCSPCSSDARHANLKVHWRQSLPARHPASDSGDAFGTLLAQRPDSPRRREPHSPPPTPASKRRARSAVPEHLADRARRASPARL